MTTELIKMPPGTLRNGVEFLPRGLMFYTPLSFEEWARLGETLLTMEAAIQFWIGDWLLFGEEAFGERASQFYEARAYQTLANYAWVARRIPVSRRRETVSWSVHAEIAACEPQEQEKWLNRAETEDLTTRDVRRERGGEAMVECPDCGTCFPLAEARRFYR